MPDNPNSHIVRVAYSGKRETETVLLDADNMSVRRCPDGFLVVELFRYGTNSKALEGYQFRFCPEDAERVKAG
jgi:hypothetical protein